MIYPLIYSSDELPSSMYLFVFVSGLLEGMNNEFVVNYINLIDGEQDPRNLMLIFNMTVIVLQHFNLGNVCYLSLVFLLLYFDKC